MNNSCTDVTKSNVFCNIRKPFNFHRVSGPDGISYSLISNNKTLLKGAETVLSFPLASKRHVTPLEQVQASRERGGAIDEG